MSKRRKDNGSNEEEFELKSAFSSDESQQENDPSNSTKFKNKKVIRKKGKRINVRSATSCENCIVSFNIVQSEELQLIL